MKKITILTALISSALVGCGSDSGSDSNDKQVAPESHFAGLYYSVSDNKFTVPGDGGTGIATGAKLPNGEVIVSLTEQGVIQLIMAEPGQASIPLVGYARKGEGSTLMKSITVYSSSLGEFDPVQQVVFTMDDLDAEDIHYTLSDDKGRLIREGVINKSKPDESEVFPPRDFDYLEQAFIPTVGTFYDYGKQSIELVADNGCTIIADVHQSGIPWTLSQEVAYGIDVSSSDCEYDDDSTGLIQVIELPEVGGIAVNGVHISGALKQQAFNFQGYVYQ